ncbi:hypothetical protein G6F59_011586 [Rhizopus arrhizus]|nr:hypothetical protein G6F59_011586 [Rhizopus arrhizus]
MDMPADDAIQATPPHVIQPGLHEALDVALGRTTALLQELRQRPVAHAQPAAHGVQRLVACQDAVVQPVTELFLQPAEVGHAVVVVAMRHQQPAAVGGHVDGASAHLHRRQHQPAHLAQRCIVVTRDVDDLGAGAAQRMQGLDDFAVRLPPVGAAMGPPPQIDDVADQVQADVNPGARRRRTLRAGAATGSPARSCRRPRVAQVAFALVGPDRAQVHFDQAVDRVTEIRVDTEGKEARTAGFAQIGVLPVQRRHAGAECGQVGLQHIECSACIQFTEARRRGEVLERPVGLGQAGGTAVIALVVRHQLLARITRQRGADRHGAEQVADARPALQVGTDALPQVVQAAAAPVVGHHEAAPQFQALGDVGDGVVGVAEQRRAVEPGQAVPGQCLRTAHDPVGAGNALRGGVPDHDVLVLRIVVVQVAAAPGALAHLAEGQFTQAAQLQQQRRIGGAGRQQECSSSGP